MSRLAAELSAAIRAGCGRVDPVGFQTEFCHWDERGIFRVMVFEPTIGCWTVVRTFDSPIGAVGLIKAMGRDVVDPRQRMPSLH